MLDDLTARGSSILLYSLLRRDAGQEGRACSKTQGRGKQMATVERRNMTQTDSKGRVLRAPKNSAETNVNFRWWVSR